MHVFCAIINYINNLIIEVSIKVKKYFGIIPQNIITKITGNCQ